MSTPPLTVHCPSCGTKFSVADHIIRGKFVKFRCKKCQGTIECDGRALSAAPPAVRQTGRVPAPSSGPARTSDAPMRLSISDGLNLEPGSSLAPPRVPQIAPPPTFSRGEPVDNRRPSDPFGLRRPPAASPQLAAPPLFTAPPTAVSADDLARLQTHDTPAEGHTTSDPPRTAATQEGGGKGWRRLGVVLLVAAAGFGGWVLARQSVPPEATSVTVVPPVSPEGKRSNAVEPGKPAVSELVKPAAEPSKPVEVTKTIDPTKAFAPAMQAPMKVIDPMAPVVAKGAPAKAAAKTEPAPAPAAAPEAPAAEPAGPTDEATAAMVAASNEHEFNKAAARSALEDGADHAASCRNIDTPAGAARVAVTFAPSGKVTSAVIESGPFVGTAAGGCVASKFRNLHIPAFTSDDPVTVHKTINF